MPHSQFADNAKLGRSVYLLEDRKALQRNVDRPDKSAKASCNEGQQGQVPRAALGSQQPHEALQAGVRVAGKLHGEKRLGSAGWQELNVSRIVLKWPKGQWHPGLY